MATIKSYTDIEQSKKLAKILPIESADMQWFLEEDYGIVQIKEELQDWGGDCTIPCWSLAALFEVIPKYIEDHYVLRMDYNKDFSIWYDEVGCGVSIELPDITKNSAIDACCEMILKLHEQKLF